MDDKETYKRMKLLLNNPECGETLDNYLKMLYNNKKTELVNHKDMVYIYRLQGECRLLNELISMRERLNAS